MGLSSTLSSALAGMHVSQRGIDVVARNVANKGTPGYHAQSVVLQDTYAGLSSQVRVSGVERAFDQALQKQHASALANSGYNAVAATFLDRLQVYLGKPGDPTSLDKLYSNFENALQAMATSPDSYTSRAEVVSAAQALAEQLNLLTAHTQEIRQEAEAQIGNHVAELNRQLNALKDINVRILDLSQDDATRLALMDERDRLVASIAEVIDVQINYRADGTVSLVTRSGIGVLDVEASQFEFAPSGPMSAGSPVGTLTLKTPAGYRYDLVEQNLLQSGRLKALVDIRDTAMVDMQNQLDDIGAAMAQALSFSSPVAATPVADGFSLDMGAAWPGFEFSMDVVVDGTARTVRVVDARPATGFPDPLPAAPAELVIGLDFSGDFDAAVAGLDAALAALDPGGAGVSVSGADGVISVVDVDPGAPSITALAGQNNFSLFSDGSGKRFDPANQTGFAGRIRVDAAVVADNSRLVKLDKTSTLGDPTLADGLRTQLTTMTFTSQHVGTPAQGGFRLNGSLASMVSQAINFQGNVVASAQSAYASSQYTLEAINVRMEAAYGVDVDEQMARLMELQNAYAASARVVSTVQELIDMLIRM